MTAAGRRTAVVVFGRKILIRDHAPFGEKREATEAVYLARDPRESIPHFRVACLDPRNKPAYPTAASDLGDEEINTRRKSDKEKDLDFEAWHFPPP